MSDDEKDDDDIIEYRERPTPGQSSGIDKIRNSENVKPGETTSEKQPPIRKR